MMYMICTLQTGYTQTAHDIQLLIKGYSIWLVKYVDGIAVRCIILFKVTPYSFSHCQESFLVINNSK